MHIKSVIKAISIVLLFIAAIMLIPLILSFVWKETPAQKAFIETIFLMAVPSTITFLLAGKSKISDLSLKDGFLFTTLIWITATVFGALPLYLTKTLPCYSDCFFEIMSGFTTTGATRLENIEVCFKSILFWRSLTNWLGGMGIVVLFVAILPTIGAGAGAFYLIGAETVGPVKSKLTPKTKTTALVLWLIYIIITVLETVLLLIGNIGLFDAVTTAFSTVSTAGFSVRNLSIEAYNSSYIEIIVTLFMILAAVNFSMYFNVFKKNQKEIIQDTELKYFAVIVTGFSIFGALGLWTNRVYPDFFTSLRHMTFHVASVISTTGFTCASYLQWPSFCLMLLVLLMFVGGCAGSTGGGIKVIRIAVLSKSAGQALSKKIHPNGVYQLSVNNRIMDKETVLSIATFCAVYIASWLLGALVISFSGASITDCLSSSILSLGNIGIGFSDKAFSTYPHWCNWIHSFLMLSGRLELFTVYVLFSKAFISR